MKSIAKQLDAIFRQAINSAFSLDADALIVPSQNEKFGDYQSNAAMGLAKQLSQKPRDVAEAIKAKLQLNDIATETSIAGPGFINVRLSADWLSKQLQAIARDDRLGIEKTDRPEKIIVEYSSPNIAKQMHIGHIRSTVLGDAMARVIDFLGHNVIRQNHIGDWGTQFGKVILAIWHMAMAKHRGEPDWPSQMGKQLIEAKNDPPRRAQVIAEIAKRHQSYLDEDPDGGKIFAPFLKTFEPSLQEIEPLYQFVSSIEDAPEAAGYMIKHGQPTKLSEQSKLITSFLQKGSEQETLAWKKVRAATLDACQRVYDRLGVQLETSDVRGESFYDPMLPDVVADLKQLGLAEESQGAIVVFIDGKEKPPMIIEKSGGHGFLYATSDLAAVRYRARELNADRVLYFVDARQTQHFRQVFETARRAGWGHDTKYQHASFGTILGKDGKPMQTRQGDNVKLADVLAEADERALRIVSAKNPELPESKRKEIAHAVGIGAIKYAELQKDRTTDYIFDWDQMLSFDGNTGPYLQYAHARIRSIFRKAGETVLFDPIALESPFETALAKLLLRFTDVIDVVWRELKPHHLCNYLYEVATKFSGFYENCPVLQSEGQTRASRLALCDITARTLALGLDLLGIEQPDQM